MRTFNNAIEIAMTGDWTTAWKVARLDDGLSRATTFEQWKAFAEKAIARRNQEGEAGHGEW